MKYTKILFWKVFIPRLYQNKIRVLAALFCSISNAAAVLIIKNIYDSYIYIYIIGLTYYYCG